MCLEGYWEQPALRQAGHNKHLPANFTPLYSETHIAVAVQFDSTASHITASIRNIMNLAQEGTKQVNEDVEFLVIGAGRRTENYIMWCLCFHLHLHSFFIRASTNWDKIHIYSFGENSAWQVSPHAQSNDWQEWQSLLGEGFQGGVDGWRLETIH